MEDSEIVARLYAWQRPYIFPTAGITPAFSPQRNFREGIFAQKF
jgi:hypothetical protein